MSVNNSGKKVSVIHEMGHKGGGLYAYTPFERLDYNNKSVYKIGCAKNFHGRFEQVYTYFPLGVYPIAFLEDPPIPRHLRGHSAVTKDSHYIKIEKFIFQYIESHGGERIRTTTRIRNVNAQREGVSEWFYTHEIIIHEAFLLAQKHFGGNDDLYSFFVKGKNVVNQKYEDNLRKTKNQYIGEISYRFR